jgi:hypothetical protein
MADTVASEQNPFGAWGKLIESTMKGNPAMPTGVEHAQEGEKDSWLTLIDQFWQANPYSKLVHTCSRGGYVLLHFFIAGKTGVCVE